LIGGGKDDVALLTALSCYINTNSVYE